jgi:NAD(P)-dependent dehydrogenase (short-subunit alcohol dehydrogenase family)
LNVIIIGASRGIGLEFVRQYRAGGAQVTATARDGAGLARLRELGAGALALDVTDAPGVAGLAAQLEGARFDIAVVNAGVYGPDGLNALQPPAPADFDAVMHTNVLGPMQVIPQLAGVLAPGARLAVLSSRMGSIGARAGSGGWLYRASKAAVNSVLKDVSLALAGRAVCVAFHPGWVRTDMGGGNADLSVEQSVDSLRRTLAALTAADNGRYLDHDGTPIPW